MRAALYRERLEAGAAAAVVTKASRTPYEASLAVRGTRIAAFFGHSAKKITADRPRCGTSLPLDLASRAGS